jgi:hypothetical protein
VGTESYAATDLQFSEVFLDFSLDEHYIISII